MDSDDFEHPVAEIWSAMGYDTQVTQGGADRGIDVIATNDSEKVLIQAKRYSSGNKVGAPKIREYSALYQQEGATDVVVVTTGEFTSNASELAPTIGVTTVDGEELSEGFDMLDSMRGRLKDFEQKYLSDDAEYGGVDISPLEDLNKDNDDD